MRHLTLPVPCISESCIEINIKLIFIFTLLCGTSKGFMKALKALIKPFEEPQRNVKRKINLIFSLQPGLRREELIEFLTQAWQTLKNEARIDMVSKPLKIVHKIEFIFIRILSYSDRKDGRGRLFFPEKKCYYLPSRPSL